ncbi:MurR/RpiR family transcriptional regulator [Paracoccus homiensis]|uniref:DNA-binding transcriptional regulator, MurR/RpiR family, contains HTH and SIS domains n=1 Tax=Paracoccus homiensis TaxID=364199 RepID=A0A1I0HGE5_9RHOB|nr:MurR/RpiR family transcriptional regulator [Paracoccus homiensis]SET82112.1 DNA-binding transcriptional regulator, MurR/RpiR family, contains HTH and SIS domains [Paracoccus homiensis]
MEPQFHDHPPTAFLSRIRSALPELHRAERKLGSFLLDFPGDLASYDAQELARLSGVSKATVSRFVRRIGFDNYETARRAARDERQTGSRHFLAHAEDIPPESQLSVSIQEEMANIAWTFDRIDTAELEALAQAIISARRVWLVGYRISRVFADYLYWQLLKVVPSASIIPQAGESLGEYTAEMTSEDVVIIVALRRKAANTLPLIQECARQAAQTALITDEGSQPDDRARWHFRARIETSSPQFNHAAVMSLCHQIVTRTTLKAGQKARNRLRLIDEANERLGEV